MFIEVNDLKGLIINLETFPPEDDPYWCEILKAVKCVFICSDEKRKEKLKQHCSGDIIFLESKVFFFFKKSQINDALLIMGLQPFEVAYVTKNYTDLTTVLSEPIGTILIDKSNLKFGETGQLPDFRLNNVSDIMSILNGELGGYYSEVAANQGTPVQQSKKGLLLLTSLDSEKESFTVVSGGRYFPSKHLKHRTHQLSRRILRSKNDTTQDQLFTEIFKGLINFTNEHIRNIDGITRVPPRPDGRRDRLIPIVQNICQQSYLDLSDKLICLENYNSQKSLGRDQRLENIKGKFHAESVKDMHVVLIDDILTTGATTTECVNTLYNAGAAHVTVVVLGINQFDVAWREPKKLICTTPGCDGERILRLRNDGTSAFFMCTNYHKNKCKGLDYLKGWQEINKLNTREEDSQDYDESFSF